MPRRAEGLPLPEWIPIGEVDRVRGLSGEVVVTVHADDPLRLARLEAVFVSEGSGRDLEETAIEGVKRLGDRAVVKLAGYENRDEAKTLVGRELFIRRESSTPAPEGRYYAYQLVGLKVSLPDGTPIGLVEEVLRQPSQDLLVIRGDRGEILVPLVRAICTDIDIARRALTVDPPEGLLDLTERSED